MSGRQHTDGKLSSHPIGKPRQRHRHRHRHHIRALIACRSSRATSSSTRAARRGWRTLAWRAWPSSAPAPTPPSPPSVPSAGPPPSSTRSSAPPPPPSSARARTASRARRRSRDIVRLRSGGAQRSDRIMPKAQIDMRKASVRVGARGLFREAISPADVVPRVAARCSISPDSSGSRLAARNVSSIAVSSGRICPSARSSGSDMDSTKSSIDCEAGGSAAAPTAPTVRIYSLKPPSRSSAV